MFKIEGNVILKSLKIVIFLLFFKNFISILDERLTCQVAEGSKKKNKIIYTS